MPLQAKTKQIMETSIPRRENFTRGNVSAKWVDKGWYRFGPVAELPNRFVKVLNEHSRATKLFVVYSYQTPIAWYSDGKWYFPDTKYSVSTTQHQNATRYALKGENVVMLTYVGGELVELEKEFF